MIIFIYGPDTFRSRRKLKELEEKFIQTVDPNASSLTTLNGAEATLKSLQVAVATGSLFVKKRLVVIENIFRNKKKELFAEILAYLQNQEKTLKDDATIIIFFDEETNTKDKSLPPGAKELFAYLSRRPFAQEFKTLNNDQLSKFIDAELKNYHKTMAPRASQRLLAITGPDLWRLHQEINKLANYQAGANINLEDIVLLVNHDYEENIFSLTDALSAKDKKRASALLEEQYLAGASEEYILAMLTRQFKILIQVKTALLKSANHDQIGQDLKLHPYVVKKAATTANKFSFAELKAYLNCLLRIDYANKSGQGDIRTEINLIVAGL